jgi:leucyl-tRNA synthetase
MRQWVLKITAYADRLLDDLSLLDWPTSTVEMQRNWIGRSIGAEVEFPLVGVNGPLRIFTTRPDTLFGATYMVLAPSIRWSLRHVTGATRRVEAYREATARKSDLQRQEGSRRRPVFHRRLRDQSGERREAADLDRRLRAHGYGTGAIMAVPGHDERDWEFARAFGLPIREVVSGGN